MAITPNGRHLPVKDPQKFTQIWTIGFKICHLATLFVTNILIDLTSYFLSPSFPGSYIPWGCRDVTDVPFVLCQESEASFLKLA
jgi:hypothetical protein